MTFAVQLWRPATIYEFHFLGKHFRVCVLVDVFRLFCFLFCFYRKLLRGLGAFFIKRKIDPIVGKKDVIYRAVLHTYVQHAMEAGHNVEFFIEGGRTRTGKPCMPKVIYSIEYF